MFSAPHQCVWIFPLLVTPLALSSYPGAHVGDPESWKVTERILPRGEETLPPTGP